MKYIIVMSLFLSLPSQADFWDSLTEGALYGLGGALIGGALSGLTEEEKAKAIEANQENVQLFRAIEANSLIAVKNAIENGANVSFISAHEVTPTPLMLAASLGNAEITRHLILSGADIHALNTRKDTSLHLASKKGHHDIVELLINAGADVNSKHKNEVTPLHYASSRGHKSIVQLLINAGADMNSKNNYNNTPLHWASSKGRYDVVKVLVEAGADLNIKGGYYRNTSLFIALEQGHDEVADFLKSHQALCAADHSSVREWWYCD